MPQHVRIAALCCCCFVVLAAGCTKTVIFKVARHEIGKDAAAQQAVRSGVWKVKWTAKRGGDFKTLESSECVVAEGQPLGFKTTDSGNVVATAGYQDFALLNLPPHAKYCVWYTREERPTQFAKEVSKALTTTGEVATISALTALVIAAELDNDDDDCRHSEGRHAKEHRRHK